MLPFSSSEFLDLFGAFNAALWPAIALLWSVSLLLVLLSVHSPEPHHANGLEGGAALDTLAGNSDASVVRALTMGYLLIYNGSIAFIVTALFMGAAGYATLATGVLPRWAGWLAYVATLLCVMAIPAMYMGPIDTAGFYNAGGWGAAIVANFPPLLWFLIVGILLLRQRPSEIARVPYPRIP
jgi:hypothetical protein